jgi:RNA polymerase subunit RPABC4/transcription elongation factor Spt4
MLPFFQTRINLMGKQMMVKHTGDLTKVCPVCGASEADSCLDLEKLGVRSLYTDHESVCPVCGGDYALIVWTGSYKMCELCAQNKEQAIRILKHKHNKKLNRILAKLDR